MKAIVPILVLAAVALAFAGQAVAVTFVVATNGNDANPGHEARPFATLEAHATRSARAMPAGRCRRAGSPSRSAAALTMRRSPSN